MYCFIIIAPKQNLIKLNILAVTTCRQYEVYSGCGNDGCRKRCDRLDVTGCVPTCGRPECICADGFVRNNAGACVPISSCRESEN